MSDYVIIHKSTRVITGLTVDPDHSRISSDEAVINIPLEKPIDLSKGPWVLQSNNIIRLATRKEFLASLDEDELEEELTNSGT